MVDLHNFDNKWPVKDADCQDRQHKIIIYTNMRKYVNEIGLEMFTYLLDNYSDIGDYGYDSSDLFTIDLTLINKKKV